MCGMWERRVADQLYVHRISHLDLPIDSCLHLFFRIQLYLNGDFTGIVAKYHRKYYGIVHDARPATLEINDELGGHMVELILITLIYIENMRVELAQD